jgi:hypothetical protein
MQELEKMISLDSPRDYVFKNILKLYENKTTNIFQLGAIETFDNWLFRIGSGWSDIWFGPHVQKYGGTFSVADISLDHLANSNLMSKQLSYNVDLYHGNGIEYLDDKYDIYYLDGSNDPRETLEQFKKILSFNKKNIHILVDDFAIKGISIDLDQYPFKIHKVEKGLGVFYYG